MRIILADGTGCMTLKHLVRDVDRHGNVRIYVRRKDKHKIRLHAEPGTDAFLEEYRAAIASSDHKPAVQKNIIPRSLRWLTLRYRESAEWQRLQNSTQLQRRRVFDEINIKHGDNPVDKMAARHVRAIRDEKADLPHAANTRIKTLGAMFSWAVEADLIEHNPVRDVRRIHVASDGHHTITADELRRFQARHPASTKAGLCGAILFYLGPRVSDAIKLGRQMETDDGRGLRMIEHKGRSRAVKITELSIHPELRKVLDLHKDKNLTYLVTAFDKPFTAKGLSNKIKEWCIEAGLPHCSAHGFRKAAATIAADNGASEYELMSMYGWTNPKQAAHYTKRANRKKLAASGTNKLRLGGQK